MAEKEHTTGSKPQESNDKTIAFTKIESKIEWAIYLAEQIKEQSAQLFSVSLLIENHLRPKEGEDGDHIASGAIELMNRDFAEFNSPINLVEHLKAMRDSLHAPVVAAS